MGFLSFIPFLLLSQLRDRAAIQSCVVVLLLLALLLNIHPWRSHAWRIPYASLPWLLWPLFLFARTPSSLEYFSEYSLRLIGMILLGLHILGRQDRPRLDIRFLLVALSALLTVQAYGIINSNNHFAQSAIFPQENLYHFVNLLALGAIAWFVAFENAARGWRGLAIFLGCVLVLSIFSGDAFNRGKWDISAGDSIGIWFGLFCGIAFGMLTNIWVKLRWKAWPLLGGAGLIIVLWGLLPLLLVQFPYWQTGLNSSITSRITFWQAASALIDENQFLGVGFGALGGHLQDYWPPLSRALYPVVAFPNAAHSHQVHIWAETGILGWLWSVSLWGAPWFFCIYKYLQSQDRKMLFWIGFFAALQSSMLVLEVTQMFLVAQLGSWLALLYIVRNCVPETARSIQLHRVWLLLLVPLVAFLVWDRAHQIYSQYLTAPAQLIVLDEAGKINNVNKALSIHAKNVPALYYIAELHRENKQFKDALSAIDVLQEISGTQWPVHRMRAEIYHDMGNETEACKHAQWPLLHSAQKRDQELRTLLRCR